MKYIETLFYLFFAGAGLLLFGKLLYAYPLLAIGVGVVLLWVGWELARGLGD